MRVSQFPAEESSLVEQYTTSSVAELSHCQRLIDKRGTIVCVCVCVDYVEVKFSPFDAADCLKQFFRELPECVFTNKLSDSLIALYEHAPVAQRAQVLRNTVFLLPDTNREALKLLLAFLHSLAQSARTHQMTTSNLAVCFAPSLFYFPKTFTPVHAASSGESRVRRATGIPDMKELLRQKAAQQCLTDLISDWQTLFSVSDSDLRQSFSVKHSRRKDGRFPAGSPELPSKQFTTACASVVSDMSEFEEECESEARNDSEPFWGRKSWESVTQASGTTIHNT